MSGFAESSPPFEPAAPSVRLRVGPDGRILIPAEMRRAAGLVPGAVVVASVMEGEVRLASLDVRIRRLQGIFAKYKRPGIDEVDAFIAEKRAEAARE